MGCGQANKGDESAWIAWPAGARRSSGRTEKSSRPGPLTRIWLMVTGDRLSLVMVRFLVVLDFTATAGKDSADGWKDSGAAGGPLAWPSQATAAPTPASKAANTATASSARRANRGLVRYAGSSRRGGRSAEFSRRRDLPGRVSVRLADRRADSRRPVCGSRSGASSPAGAPIRS